MIPDSVASIGSGAFEDCYSLKNITIGSGVTSIGNCAFYNCSSLESITIPDSVTSIGDNAFEACKSIKSVTIGSGVTSIAEDAFRGTAYYNNQSNWENDVLYIGNYLIKAKSTISGSYSIKEGTKIICDSAFVWCTSLTSVTIPNTVTSISKNAFYVCSSLERITISNSVTSIGSDAFTGCSNLSDITYTGTKSRWNALWSTYPQRRSVTGVTVHCSDGNITL